MTSGVATPSWPSLLTVLLRGDDLTAEGTAWAMEQIMLGDATPAQIAGFVVALRAKGEAPAEMIGLVTTMLNHAERIQVEAPAVDTCGTGGDRAHTVNISTMSAMVVAGAGVRVVKHGNRAASSACGSADLLEELGVVVDAARKGGPHVVPALHRALSGAVALPALDDRTVDVLTSREREVLVLLAEGRANREIAGALCVTLATVKSHLVRIYTKLEAGNRNEALGRAVALGLLR